MNKLAATEDLQALGKIFFKTPPFMLTILLKSVNQRD